MSSKASAFSIPAIYFRLLVNNLIDRGYDCSSWLKAAHLSYDQIMRPEATIALPQADRLLSEIEMATGRRDWGFELGTMLRLTSHGSVGFAMVSSATLRDSVMLCSRYYRLMVPIFALEVREEGDLVGLYFRRVTTIPTRLRHFYEEAAAVSAVLQTTKLAASDKIHFDVRLAQPAPSHLARYTALKNAVFRFNDPDTPGATVYFPRSFLSSPNPMGDPGSQALAEEICQRKIDKLDRLEGWTDWVSNAIRTSEGGRPTQAELARLLNVSARTLERALTREGSSFKNIYESVGFERARDLLKERRMSISQISERLGYSNIGAFSRAFKRLSGMTPSEFIQCNPEQH